ncbi:hypothetical protein VYU27_008236 [Nannochloropsis oceanica]
MRHRHVSAFAPLSYPPTPPPPSSHSPRSSPWPSTATATSAAAYFLLLFSPLSSLLLPLSAASASTLSTRTSILFLGSSSTTTITTAITTTTTSTNLIAAGAADKSISVTPPSILLLPIVKIELALTNLGPLLQPPSSSSSSSPSSSSPSDWATAKNILSSPPFTKGEFKRIFNQYADTIYRTDTTDVMGGQSAPPAPLQSIQYLYRNEILTACEELRDELSYLLSEQGKGPEGDWHDLSGLEEAYGKALENMQKYLSLAPPDDVESVRKAVKQQLQ